MLNYLLITILGSAFISSLTGIVGAFEMNPPGILKKVFKHRSEKTKLVAKSIPLIVLIGGLFTALFYLTSTLPIS